MINFIDSVDPDFTRTGAREIIRKFTHAVVTLVILTASPLQSLAATLHYDPSTGYVTSITELQVGRSVYDATFHLDLSFNDIWDVDGDGIFGEGDGSVINHAPVFWQDGPAAFLAAEAVMQSLGGVDMTSIASDGFHIPTEYSRVSPRRR